MAGECYDPIFTSPKAEPIWVNGRRPPETEVSYYEVARGEGRTYDAAYGAAEKDVVRKRSMAVGRQAQINGEGGVALHRDEFEILAKVEKEYLKQCRADEYSVYLLVQIGKRPDVRLPPFPESWLESEQNEKKDSKGKKADDDSKKKRANK